MFKKKKFLLLYIVIFLLGAFLRLYKINQIPPGVNQDEASIGYTAYSLIHTGKDEYGRSFPLSFQSFGDWKLPLYMYETVVSVKFLGLNEFAVRLPSALVGIGTVAIVFFLVQQLFKNNTLSFLTMFLTAIAPWSIHLSRVESESNTAVFLTTFAMYLLLKSLEKRYWLIIPSIFLLTLTYFTYAGNYIFTTLLVIGIVLFYWNTIPKSIYKVIAVIIFFVIGGFIGLQTLTANHTKVSGIGIFGDPAVIHSQIEIPRNEHKNPNAMFAKIIHNKIVFGLERFVQNYYNAYSPQFLFIQGGTNHAHNIEGFGNMYLIEAPFLFFGLLFFITQKKGRERNLILWWFFIAPLAASITKDAPHTNRMFAIFPILPLITASGIYFVKDNVKKYQLLFIPLVSALFLLNIGIYIDTYYIHFPHNEVASWGNGYKQLYEVLSTKYPNKKIIMSQPQTEPYIYLLFYSHYDPAMYQKQAVRYPITDDGFVYVKHYGNYTFKDIDWDKDLHTTNTILIDVPSKTPEFVKYNYVTSDIILPNDKAMFTLVETK